MLLEFARDTAGVLGEDTRADAADVIMRLGIGDQKKVARQIITDLGFSSVDILHILYDSRDQAEGYSDNKKLRGVEQFSGIDFYRVWCLRWNSRLGARYNLRIYCNKECEYH